MFYLSSYSGFGVKGNLSHEVCFYIGDTVIENVVSWPHLGHNCYY